MPFFLWKATSEACPLQLKREGYNSQLENTWSATKGSFITVNNVYNKREKEGEGEGRAKNSATYGAKNRQMEKIILKF